MYVAKFEVCMNFYSQVYQISAEPGSKPLAGPEAKVSTSLILSQNQIFSSKKIT